MNINDRFCLDYIKNCNGHPLIRSFDSYFFPVGSEIREDLIEANLAVEYKIGEPCTHKGCINHVSHPCENCGRLEANEAIIMKKEN